MLKYQGSRGFNLWPEGCNLIANVELAAPTEQDDEDATMYGLQQPTQGSTLAKDIRYSTTLRSTSHINMNKTKIHDRVQVCSELMVHKEYNY